ncbi:ABC transporter substrate-binding protein [Undibacterium sp.]|jgi:ABC-type nitrate/sulfonate/bicarbonate transport system substrate-binding protein|uniref:ABC transporter substrate-binding protein n=1 Tax=Undibacterium sp. TaxID=1914977 RepID=UPI002C4AF9E2|nr:ABC transporter substrate-binding protein [Undibacterium sp.]HTD02429.1 ABC transporter substrate-binding protein [Undibacterium sp.]
MKDLPAVFRILGLLMALSTPHLFANELIVAVSTTGMSTPFYVAEKLGLFAQEGLKVKILDCNSGSRCIKQMFDGKAQLSTVSDLPIMFNSFERQDLVVLSTFCTANFDTKLIVHKNANITSVKDLLGKRIAVPMGTSSQYAFDLVALSQGLDPRGMGLINMDPERMPQAMLNHKIDVAAVFEPTAYKVMQALAGEGQKLQIDSVHTLSFNLVTLRPTLNTRKEDMVRLMRALDNASLYIQNHQGRSKAILLEHLKLEQAFIAWAWSDFRFNLVLTQSLLTSLESEARWAVRENLISHHQIPNFLDVLEPAVLRKVRPGSVTLLK